MAITALIETGLAGSCRSITPVSGGDIHRAYRVEATDGRIVFVKANSAQHADVLYAEYVSLTEMKIRGAHYYPAPIGFEKTATDAVLLMTFHTLTPLTTASAVALAHHLYHQHEITHAQFGWPHENHIGTTPQFNQWDDSWVHFYRQSRLQPQLERAITNGLSAEMVRRVNRLIDTLDRYIDDASVSPALLHGDLWGGNAAGLATGEDALLFDPAPYYGDREADLAMTRLFGGFPQPFYDAYLDLWPLGDGHKDRVGIYNLYHALNHYNLFGSSYSNLIDACLPDKI